MLNDTNAPRAAGQNLSLSVIAYAETGLRIVLATANGKQAFVCNEALIAGVLTGKGTITVFDETKTSATAKPYICKFFDEKVMKEMGISATAPDQKIPPLPAQAETLPALLVVPASPVPGAVDIKRIVGTMGTVLDILTIYFQI